MDWVAPAADVESVTFNYVGNTVDGNSSTSGDDPTEAMEKVVIKSSGTGVNGNFAAVVDQFHLYQNHPNPFNPTTTIRYNLSKSTNVSLKVYNLAGQEVATLVNSNQPAGENSVIWDARNNSGNLVSSGVYLYRLQIDNNVQSKKLTLLR